MDTKTIASFSEILSLIDQIISDHNDILLFRGQGHANPLLPSIARSNSSLDTTSLEGEMLEELKRRSPLVTDIALENDWQWLIYAQHFGLKTRLLDWTSNPLVALWFACNNNDTSDQNFCLYIFKADKKFLVDENELPSPFQYRNTKILRPLINNPRIVAQSGWFTSHKYDKNQNRWVPLEENPVLSLLLTKIEIPVHLKIEILEKIGVLGVNNQTMYPDIVGLCHHLNWKFRDELIGKVS